MIADLPVSIIILTDGYAPFPEKNRPRDPRFMGDKQ